MFSCNFLVRGTLGLSCCTAAAQVLDSSWTATGQVLDSWTATGQVWTGLARTKLGNKM